MTTRPVMVCAASLRSWHKPRQARVAGEAYVRTTLRAGNEMQDIEVNINKLDAVEMQLDAAIFLFFENRNIIACETLG